MNMRAYIQSILDKVPEDWGPPSDESMGDVAKLVYEFRDYCDKTRFEDAKAIIEIMLNLNYTSKAVIESDSQ